MCCPTLSFGRCVIISNYILAQKPGRRLTVQSLLRAALEDSCWLRSGRAGVPISLIIEALGALDDRPRTRPNSCNQHEALSLIAGATAAPGALLVLLVGT